MLSGVGIAADLKKIGVPLVADLPVGKVLRDSFVAPIEFETKIPPSPFGTNTAFNRLSYLVSRQGPLGIPRAQAIATKGQDEVGTEEGSPSVHVRLVSDAANGRLLLEPTLVNPQGHGSVSLISSNPFDPPLVSLDPSAVDDDIAALVEGVVMGDSLVKKASLRSLIGSHASQQALCPNPKNGVCKQYDVRHMASTAQRRASSACVGSVVDERLKVIGGIAKLRVVDTAAAAVGCGEEDEWCSEAIAQGAAHLIASEN
jgi:choline dehydrogenase